MVLPHEWMYRNQHMCVRHRGLQADICEARPSYRPALFIRDTVMMERARHGQPVQLEAALKFRAVCGKSISIETEFGAGGRIQGMIEKRPQPIVMQQPGVPVRQIDTGCGTLQRVRLIKPARSLSLAQRAVRCRNLALLRERAEQRRGAGRQTACEAGDDVLHGIQLRYLLADLPYQRQAGAAPFLHEAGLGNGNP